MKRHGFLLGMLATATQVLLLRELGSSLHGGELFVGTAMAGWLLAVAAGATRAGRTHRPPAAVTGQMTTTALLLPLQVIAVRLAPVLVAGTAGRTVGFTAAAALSFLFMVPAGFACGLLFGRLARTGADATDSVLTVYLWEGIGAFAAGLAVSAAAGPRFGTLALSVTVAGVVAAGLLVRHTVRRTVCAAAIAAAAIALGFAAAPSADRFLDGLKYPRFDVVRSFDTRYGHQTVLRRDGTFTLLTDNAVEESWPDPESAENRLLPPLLLNPGARALLYLGRADAALATLAARMPQLSVTCVDARGVMPGTGSGINDAASPIFTVSDDPLRFLAARPDGRPFDVIVMPLSDPAGYRTSRLITRHALERCRRRLAGDGVLCVITPYDSDRYLSDEAARALAVVRNTLGAVFASVEAWPGGTTALFASTTRQLSLPSDSIDGRVARLPIMPDFIDASRLSDRLSDMKRERLNEALGAWPGVNSLDRPQLPHLHLSWLSRRLAVDRAVIRAIISSKMPLALMAAGLFLFAGFILLAGRGRHAPLFLLFTAGATSLTVELAVFYAYQSAAGALYSHLAVLIGAFMLGLSAGTWHAKRNRPANHAAVAITILLMLVPALAVWTGGRHAGPSLAFFTCQLFLTAAATGMLFADAAGRFLRDASQANRGTAYAWETAGAAVGAFFTLGVALPAIGLNRLLAVVSLLLVTALTMVLYRGKQ